MVEEITKKLVKLRAILERLRGCIFKIFFNQGEGDDNEIGQIKGNWNAYWREIFQSFFNHGEWDTEEIGQIEGHSGASSKMYFQNFVY